MLKKISSKIIIFYSGLILTLTIFLLVFFSALVRDIHLSVLKREMNDKAEVISLELPALAKPLPHNALVAERRHLNRIAEAMEVRATVIMMDGRVIADSSAKPERMDNHRYRPEVMAALKQGSGSSIRYSNTIHVNMLYFAKKGKGFIVRVARPLYDINASISRAQHAILITLIIFLATGIVLNVVISRVISKPITEAIDFAENFSRGDFSLRIYEYRNDEIGSLQRALNRLADSLVQEIQSMAVEQKKLRTVIEHNQDAIVMIGADKNIIIANNVFMRLWNEDTPVEGKLYFTVIRNSSLNAKVEYSLESREVISFDEEMRGAEYGISITPISELEDLQGVLIVMRDITESKRVDRLKTELVGNLSHELKTPITIVRGYLETVLENTTGPDRLKDYLEKALSALERQNSIINDMLKLNMLETGTSIEGEYFQIEEILKNCVTILKPKADARRIVVDVSLPVTAPFAHGNIFLAEEIFLNIIDNAITYNRDGGRIDISSITDAKGTTFTIKDTGIGIPDESAGRLFERFYRVDKSRSRQSGGTGLGLSIVKHAADLLGWEVGLESEVGAGSTFSVCVPATPNMHK